MHTLEKDSKLNLYCLDLCAQLQIQCNHLPARSLIIDYENKCLKVDSLAFVKVMSTTSVSCKNTNW